MNINTIDGIFIAIVIIVGVVVVVVVIVINITKEQIGRTINSA
jgi:hypothetical protein